MGICTISISFTGFPLDEQNCTLHFIEAELMVCNGALLNVFNVFEL